MRYILLVLAVIFLGSGVVQFVFGAMWVDAFAIGGGIVQIIIGSVLMYYFLKLQRKHNIREYRKRKAIKLDRRLSG